MHFQLSILSCPSPFNGNTGPRQRPQPRNTSELWPKPCPEVDQVTGSGVQHVLARLWLQPSGSTGDSQQRAVHLANEDNLPLRMAHSGQ